MKQLTLKQLRYFNALAHHGHFGKASDACAISQPALSMQIKELEQVFGSSLFERGVKRVGLTPLGKDLFERTKKIIQSVDDLADMARAQQLKFTGQIRIGIIPTIAPYLLPALIGRLSASYPELELHIRETQTHKLIEELVEGRLDTAVLALPISEPLLQEEPLFTENFVLVRPSSDETKPVPNADALSKMRLLLLEEGHCFRDQALSFCSMKTGLPKDSLEGSSLSTLVQMVGSGIGVTLIPEMAVPIETHSADVSVAIFPRPAPSRTIGMVWRKTTPLSELLVNIADHVKTALEQQQSKVVSV